MPTPLETILEVDESKDNIEIIGRAPVVQKKTNQAKKFRKEVNLVTDGLQKTSRYGFKDQIEEDRAIELIIKKAEQQVLVKPKNQTLRNNFLNGNLSHGKKNNKALEGLRDEGVEPEIVFTLKKGSTAELKAPKCAGNDEFLQTSWNLNYYNDSQSSTFRGRPFGYKEASVYARQGTDTFVHRGNSGDLLSGHTGHLYRDRLAMSSNKTGITSWSVSNEKTSNVSGKGKNTYHGIRHSEVIDGYDRLKPPIGGLKDSVRGHIRLTYNYGKIESELNKTTSNIFTAQGFVLPMEGKDFARNMQLNRDKQKVCMTALKADGRGRKIDSLKDLNYSLRQDGISPVRCSTPISMCYIKNIIKRANGTRDINELGGILQSRAPVIKT